MPDRKQETIAPFVTETKQMNKTSECLQNEYKLSEGEDSQDKSSEEENYTGNGSGLPVTQVKMSITFYTKLKHLLTNYYFAIRDKYEV